MTIDTLIQKANEIHSAPGVARSVLNLTREPEYDIAELVQCLEADPALTGRVLATVNSSKHGLPMKVTNLQQAVTLLGKRSLRLIAMTFSIVDTFTRGTRQALYNDYWRRALTMAWVARRMCRDCRGQEAADAYTAGLLADVGVLLLAQFEPERYTPLCKDHPHGLGLVVAEQEEFGFDHAALCAKLLESWEFPAPFCEAVSGHHCDQRACESHLANAVHGASLMPGAIWTGDNSAIESAKDWLRKRFRIEIDQFIDLVIQIKDAVEIEAKIYGIDSTQFADGNSILEESRTRYSHEAVQNSLELDSIESLLNGQCDRPSAASE